VLLQIAKAAGWPNADRRVGLLRDDTAKITWGPAGVMPAEVRDFLPPSLPPGWLHYAQLLSDIVLP
jgi:hypothetical protein